MSLTTRLHTSWELFQRSFEVIRAQPRLLLFPVLSTALSLVLAAFFFTPVVLLLISVHNAGADWDAAAQQFRGAFYAYGAFIYVVSMILATFFNVAFYSEILRALSGETVSIANGLRFAMSRIRAILLWSLLAATVGLIIRAIEDRLGWIGKFVMGLVGTAWSVAAVFSIPVIIRRQDNNPLSVLRDSATTLKRTWGESLAGYVGIQLGGGLVILAVIGLTILTAVLGHLWLNSMLLPILVVATGLLLVVAIGMLLTMAGHVYRCALYVYASEGVVPGTFTPELLNAGWKVKKRK